MNKRKLGCPEEIYEVLRVARDKVIDLKILVRWFERDAEHLEKIGALEQALRLRQSANRLLGELRFWEEEVKRLEAECFGGR